MSENVSRMSPRGAFAQLDARKAALSVLADGITKKSAREAGLTEEQFLSWSRSHEGQLAIRAAQCQLDSLLQSRLTEIIMRASGVILDALENGDHKLVNSKIMRVPVSLKEASQILATAFDKRQIMRGLPTQIADVDQRLIDLADKLRGLSLVKGAAVSAESPR